MTTVLTLDPDLYEPLDDVIARQPVSVASPGFAVNMYLSMPDKPRNWQEERHQKLYGYPRVRIKQELTPDQDAENEAWRKDLDGLTPEAQRYYLRERPCPHPEYIEYIRKADAAEFEHWLFGHRVEEAMDFARFRDAEKQKVEAHREQVEHRRTPPAGESRLRLYLTNAAIGGAAGGTFAILVQLLA